jgi:hypothetical protein
MSHTDSRIHETELTFEFRRHVGGRFVHGCVTLRLESCEHYEFSSFAAWPLAENHDGAVRQSVEQVLIERLGTLDGTKVVLSSIRWDPVSSSEAGFRRAARAATIAAFEA